MFKIIDRYILKNFLKNMIIGILGSLLIFFSKELLKIIYQLTSGNINFYEAQLVALHTLPSIVSFDMMHLATVFGSLLTMADLNSNLELIALKTSGIKFRRIIIAPLIFTFVFSGFLAFFTEYISVAATKKAGTVWNRIRGFSSLKIKRDIYFKSKNNYFVRIEKANGYNNIVENIQIVFPNETFSKANKIFSAKSARYNRDNQRWVLENLSLIDVENNSTTFLKEYEIDLVESIDDFLRVSFPKEEMQKQLSLAEIKENIKFLKSSGGNFNLLLTHLHHRRIAYPFAVFVMTIIGLSLVTGFSRGGKGLSIVLGVLIGFSYYVVVEIAFAFGLGKIIPVILSAWVPNFLFLIFGLYFFKKAEY